MHDSAPSVIVTVTSPAQVPAAPKINSVLFKGLQATVNVTLPGKDADGNLYPLTTTRFTAVKIFVGPTGSLTPESMPEIFPVPQSHDYQPDQSYDFEVTVPAYSTAYDFEAEVSI